MDAKELQIGDWVKDKYKPKPHRVDSWADFNSAEDLSPIPLTPEILEKNGFKVEEEVEDMGMGLCNCYSFDYDSVVIFWADSYNTMTPAGTEDFVEEQWRMEVLGQGGSFEKYTNMLYVHELQRALRCCGLWDLAENFKI